MLRSYLIEEHSDSELEDAFISHTNWDVRKGRPTVVSCDETLENKIYSEKFHKGFTGTAGGFYGPQGRVVRLNIQDPELNHKMDTFNHNGTRMTNLEMETSAIYGLGKLLGHNCLSLNAIIANRAVGEFSSNPEKTVNELIAYTLDKLVESNWYADLTDLLRKTQIKTMKIWVKLVFFLNKFVESMQQKIVI
jgi:uridine phosphorylase